MAKKEKKKREKVVWVDDGRTIADMSNLPTRGISRSLSDANPKRRMSESERRFNRSGLINKDHLATYLAAVRMMFLPMLATIGIISLAFLILYVLSRLA